MTKKLPLAVALSAFALACSDPTMPAVTRMLPQSASSYALIPHQGYPFPSTATLGDGVVRLCKVSNVAGTFGFDVTVPGGGGVTELSITVGAGQLNTPVCRATPLYNSNAAGNVGESVTIVEDNPGANWAVVIDVDQYWTNTVNYGAVNPLGDTFNPATRTATVVINDDLEKVVTFRNTFTPPSGNQGCTPGYWKQAQHADSWNAPYDPTDDFDATFGVNLFNPNITLLDALNLNGGGAGLNQLARAAVAALLNAAEGFYPMTTAQVIAAVQGATPATYEAVKNTFDTNNNLGCPLN